MLFLGYSLKFYNAYLSSRMLNFCETLTYICIFFETENRLESQTTHSKWTPSPSWIQKRRRRRSISSRRTEWMSEKKSCVYNWNASISAFDEAKMSTISNNSLATSIYSRQHRYHTILHITEGNCTDVLYYCIDNYIMYLQHNGKGNKESRDRILFSSRQNL